MSLRLSLFYGVRNFLGRKKTDDKKRRHLSIPILSIAFSLVPVIVTLVVANGMIEGITLRYLEFGTGHLTLALGDRDQVDKVRARLAQIQKRPDVACAFMEIQGGGLLFHKGKRFFVSIRGVPADLYARDEGFARYTALDRGAFDLTASRSIVIGRALANELGIAVGDALLVVTHRTDTKDGRTTFIPRPNRFTVRGVYSIGYQELDKRTVFISDSDARQALSPNNSNISLKVKMVDPFTAIDEKAASLEKDIDPQAHFWRIRTWREINANYFNAFQSIKVILIFIMLIIVIVAAFNIVSSMIMVVLDRLQEIGILKSLGSSSASITLSFMCLGFVTGLLSVVMGVAAGLLIAVNINEIFAGLDALLTGLSASAGLLASPFTGLQPTEAVKILNPEFYLEVIPIRLEFWELAAVSLFALCLSVFFSFFPARWAGGTRPLEVIRKH